MKVVLIDFEENEVIATCTTKEQTMFIVYSSMCTGDNYISGGMRYLVVNKEVNIDNNTITVHLSYLGLETDTQTIIQKPGIAPDIN